MKKKLQLLVLLCMVTASVFAAPIYQVEMIVFSHIQPVGLNSENWPIIESPQIDLKNAWTLHPLSQQSKSDAGKLDSYQALPNYYFHLNKQHAKLINSGRYQPLLHLTWYQDMLTPKSAHWVHIFGGKGYDNSGKIIAENYDGSAQYNQAQYWQVDGLVHISLKRYFDAQYKLAFATQTELLQSLSQNDNFKGIDTPLLYFNLDQTRRMRSGELNFIDHPLFGVLVKISKAATS